jgi:tetratricopeptide (TPR) repeat protein
MKALEIDPTLAEAHTPLAYAETHYRWRWAEAEHGFHRAIALDPSYVHAHHWHSHLLMAQGRVGESLVASRRALELDPLDLIINVHLAWHFWLAREYDEAIEQSARTADIEERNPWSHFFAGLAHGAKGEFAKAIARHRESVPLSGDSTVMRAALGWSYAAAGERGQANDVLRDLKAIADTKPVSAYEIALIHGALGETDEAFEWLERAYEQRSAWLAYLAVDPRLDGIRADERFTALLRGVGLRRES